MHLWRSLTGTWRAVEAGQGKVRGLRRQPHNLQSSRPWKHSEQVRSSARSQGHWPGLRRLWGLISLSHDLPRSAPASRSGAVANDLWQSRKTTAERRSPLPRGQMTELASPGGQPSFGELQWQGRISGTCDRALVLGLCSCAHNAAEPLRAWGPGFEFWLCHLRAG